MNCGYEIKWSSQLWTQFLQFVKKPENFRTSYPQFIYDPFHISFRRSFVHHFVDRFTCTSANVIYCITCTLCNKLYIERWNDIWNGSYMNCGYEIKWSYDPRRYERNFCNCVKKPENFRTSYPQFIYDPFHISFHLSFIPHGNIRTHKWPAPNVSGFIAQKLRS